MTSSSESGSCAKTTSRPQASVELLSPAGSLLKLEWAFAYGADAAYIGLSGFSLRAKSDDIDPSALDQLASLKARWPGRRVFAALNVLLSNERLASLESLLEQLASLPELPIDAFIVQDMGALPLLQKHLPHVPLHLSTQASCINSSAAKVYHSLGFSRVVLGREASLDDVRRIKDAVPALEIECFCHGAMCMAYSGRCLLSAAMSGRSAQAGLCSHPCRWQWQLEGEHSLREQMRPTDSFPLVTGEGFSAILSSKDLCMLCHVADLQRAGVDAIKIEGRMKSIAYTSLTTRAYRKEIDALEGKCTREEAQVFAHDVWRTATRPFWTGFYYDTDECTRQPTGDLALSARILERISGEQEAELLAKAQAGEDLHQRKRDELCPQARAALQHEEEKHPERVPRFAKRRQGWLMYGMEMLGSLGEHTQAWLVCPARPTRKLVWGEEFVLLDTRGGFELARASSCNPCVLYTKADISAYSFLLACHNAAYNHGIDKHTRGTT